MRVGEIRQTTHYRSIILLGIVRTDDADGDFDVLGHVGVNIPQPVDYASAGCQGDCAFALEYPSLIRWTSPPRVINLKVILQASFLNQKRLTRLLGDQRIPQQCIVEPPRVICGEVRSIDPVRSVESIGAAAFVLANGDELFTAGSADRLPDGLRPYRELLLREEIEVMHGERVATAINATRREIFFCRRRNRKRQRGHVPCICYGIVCAVQLAEELVPGLRLKAVTVG